MKILHLIYTHGISGAEKYLKHLLPGLKQHGIICDLIVVCPSKYAETITGYCDELRTMGVKSTLIVANRFSIIKTARAINDYLKVNDISIVHSHLLNSDLIAAVLKNLFFKKLFLISTKHGYREKVLQQYEQGKFTRLHDLYYYITKYTFRKIDVNVAVSKGMSELFYNLNLSKTIFPFIHHGISVEEFDMAAYKDVCRISDQQLIIVGRIELIKGHRYLIEALPAVIKVFPTVSLLVLGEGSEKENCIAQAQALGIQRHIQFLGFQPHPYSFISHSDIVVLPSLFEPFGLVYIEAFALKTAVVAFDTSAGNEIMENYKTALLVPKGDSNALAEKIIYLLQNESERKKMSERAYLQYQHHFSTETMVKNTAKWYKTLGV